MADDALPMRSADLSGLKALAHPLRQEILRWLAAHGPATSTSLARALGGTTGGTSYNLRVLAEHGFVEEVPERSHGRERWWRHVETDLRLPVDSAQDDETRSTLADLHQLWFAEDTEALERFQQARPELGEWADALPYSRGEITVTVADLRAFFEEYLALLGRYQQPSDAGDVRTVQTRFMAFPTVDVVEGDDAADGPDASRPSRPRRKEG